MPLQRLTDTQIASIQPPPTGRVEITDPGTQGLRLRVTSAGVRTFAFVYRDRITGKTQRLTLGKYPGLSLKVARDRVAAHLAAIARDESPAEVRRDRIEKARAAITFDALATAYMEGHAKRHKLSWRNDEGYLKRPRAAWGDRPAASIRPADVVELLDRIAETAPVSANRTQAVLSKMYTWGMPLHELPSNPVHGLARRGGKERPKDRVLDVVELRRLFDHLDDTSARTARPVALALKTIALTIARPGEVAGMTSRELVGLGSTAPEWHIPSARTKNRKPIIVPLSKAAAATVREALALPRLVDEAGNGPVFASKFDRTSTLARHSLSQAAGRIGTAIGLEAFTPHDLRRSGATLARRCGARRDVVKALLNHVEDDVTAIYDLHDLGPEKRIAVEAVARAILNES